MNRQSAASLVALALVLAISITAGAEAAPGIPKAPGPLPANPGTGRITQADIDFFKHWEGEADKADENLRQGIEAFSKACTVVKNGPAVAKPPFKRAARGLVPVAAKLEALWQDLDKAATKLDGRRQSYDDPKIKYIVGATSDLLSHDFFERRSGVEGGLKSAAESIARLDCSVAEQLADYKRERTNEQKDFPESIKSLEKVLAHEP